MQYTLEYTADCAALAEFSAIIDVRSPSEYLDDHIPGAINLPVLDDAERVQVGTLHQQHSPFDARKAGAALVASNIGALLAGPLAEKPRDYRPLVYCWRGGMRSRSLAIVLRQIGWPAVLLDGGYKHYRAWVRAALAKQSGGFTLLRLAGSTGCGKTAILQRLAARGCQVLDLEGLAQHRGSVLGGSPDGAQPTQKRFESLLWDRLRQFDPNRPLWVESESSKIGRLHCPAELWRQMKAASVVFIDAPRAARVALLLAQYRHFVDDPALLKHSLSALKTHVGRQTLDAWYQLIDQRRWPQFVDAILEAHYDRVYGSLRELAYNNNDSIGGSNAPDVVEQIILSALDAASLDRCAEQLANRYG